MTNSAEKNKKLHAGGCCYSVFLIILKTESITQLHVYYTCSYTWIPHDKFHKCKIKTPNFWPFFSFYLCLKTLE